MSALKRHNDKLTRQNDDLKRCLQHVETRLTGPKYSDGEIALITLTDAIKEYGTAEDSVSGLVVQPDGCSLELQLSQDNLTIVWMMPNNKHELERWITARGFTDPSLLEQVNEASAKRTGTVIAYFNKKALDDAICDTSCNINKYFAMKAIARAQGVVTITVDKGVTSLDGSLLFQDSEYNIAFSFQKLDWLTIRMGKRAYCKRQLLYTDLPEEGKINELVNNLINKMPY